MSRNSRSEKIAIQSVGFNLIPYLNAGLLLLVGVFLALYIIRVNNTADLRYKTSLLRSDLAKQNQLTQEYFDQEPSNVQALVVFAQGQGMIEVKNFDPFFEESGVALK